MESRIRPFAVSLVALGALLGTTAQVVAADVTGTVVDKHGKAKGTLKGTFELQSFTTNDAGKIVGVGLLTGSLTNPGGHEKSTVSQVVQIPVSALGVEHIAGNLSLAPDACDILFLQLGPIDLNLLGLIVHVDQITVDIDADPSDGIVGQLLCALAGPDGLLDLNGLLDTILASITLADLLNFLNGLLG